MRPRIYVLFVIIAIAIGGALLTCYLQNQRDARNADAARRNAQTAALRSQWTRLHRQTADAEQSRAALESKIAQAKAEAEASAKSKKVVFTVKPDWFEQLNSNPKVQAYFLQYQRSGMGLIYAPLLRKLHLSPADTTTFLENMVRHLGDQRDVTTTQQAKGLDDSDPAIQALNEKIMATYNESQRQLLGESAYTEFKSYEKELQPRMAANAIAGAAVIAGVPFSRDQVNQLAEAVKAATPRPDAETDWDRVDEQAKVFLTSEQLKFIQTSEALGPMGFGWRFQSRLNDSITNGYNQDHAAKQPNTR